jgi:fucose 4-O-acetylase-like acetyltransferase
MALRRVSETTLPPRVELVLVALVGPTALFVIGTFFFLSGLFAPSNIARHGPAGFLRQRLVGLGLPWLLFTLLIWPVLMWSATARLDIRSQIWEAWQARQPFLDSGRLWFVQILLYVSLFHALLAWRGYGRELEPRTTSLVLTAGCIAAASFAVRLWFPARSQQILDLHVWQWPQCVGLYVLRVLVADKG